MIQADIQANRLYSSTHRVSQANIRNAVDREKSIKAHRGTRRLLLWASIGPQSLAALLGTIIVCLIFDICHRPPRDGRLLVLLCSEMVDPPVLTVVVLDLLELWRLARSIGTRPATGPLPSPTSSPGDVMGSLLVTHPPNHGTASLLFWLRLCLGAVMTCRFRPHICQMPLYSPMIR